MLKRTTNFEENIFIKIYNVLTKLLFSHRKNYLPYLSDIQFS